MLLRVLGRLDALEDCDTVPFFATEDCVNVTLVTLSLNLTEYSYTAPLSRLLHLPFNTTEACDPAL